jgi:ubiquinone/menaquinone biosynthesis C-methylase UbiE
LSSSPAGRLSIRALAERDRKESNGELRTILLNHLSEGSRDALLDVRGGTGQLTETLADVFGWALVLDLDSGKLAYGRGARPGVGFVRGGAQGIPVADGRIGTLVSVAAFHHFPDQDRALDEMGRVLKPRGTLLLVEIDPSTIRGRILNFTENRLARAGSRFVTPAELLKKVESHGFLDARLDRTSRGYVVVATRSEAGPFEPVRTAQRRRDSGSSYGSTALDRTEALPPAPRVMGRPSSNGQVAIL